jgi:uncharacterized protein
VAHADRTGSSQAAIAATESYVAAQLAGDSSGHDWWHVARVRALALRIAEAEEGDPTVVELAALLHDVADWKVSGSETAGAEAAQQWLSGLDIDTEVRDHVVAIVAGVSFKGSAAVDVPLSVEGSCVRDADRLDAMGAIGIARTFAYGGHVGQPLHDPGVAPQRDLAGASYRASRSSTINHFHEKLLLLRDRMTTATGRELAEHRHQVMQDYLLEFHAEWDGRDSTETETAGVTGLESARQAHPTDADLRPACHRRPDTTGRG